MKFIISHLDLLKTTAIVAARAAYQHHLLLLERDYYEDRFIKCLKLFLSWICVPVYHEAFCAPHTFLIH